MKKKLAAVLVSLSMLLGFSVVAAPAAQAVNYYNCYWRYAYTVQGLGAFYDRICYADYSWYEEVFLGRHDGWVKAGGEIRGPRVW